MASTFGGVLVVPPLVAASLGSDGNDLLDAIRPEALVKSPELENELSVQKWSLNSIDLALRDSPEARIACDVV